VNVPSLTFLGFALIGAVGFNLLPAGAWRKGLLLALNLAFFASFLHAWSEALPYAGFLLAGWIGATTLQQRKSRALFLVSLVLVLFGFFWLKRYSFVPRAIDLPFAYTAVGLSYVFFRVLHLVIDAGQGEGGERIGLVDYLNYTLSFPALVSGPIQLYCDYRAQEAAPQRLDLFSVSRAGERIITGLFKVVVVSALLTKGQQAAIAQLAHAQPFAAKVVDCALIGAIYPLFLYANFSGYTDFVIGVARLYRFQLPENFSNPFIAENFISFWSRWHITLSNWLKTYVYTPLLMSLMRRFPSPAIEPFLAVAAYFITFFLIGAWHGQTAKFLFFGVLQGGGVAINKLYQIAMTQRLTRKGYRALCARPWYRAASRALTFTWFAFTLLWFWSSWGQLGGLAAEAGWAAATLGWLLVFVLAVPALSLLHAVQGPHEARVSDPLVPPASRYWRTAAGTAILLVVVGMSVLISGPAPDVVYKSF
jgi:D-alanyl-lipoteichoic acid acyltransferase DltB (MBOAT superfamily)